MFKRMIFITILLVFSIYVAILLYTGKIIFYINPRYITLTQIFTVIAIFIGSAALIRQFELLGKHVHSHGWEKGEVLGTVILVVILGIGLILPVKSLSVATAAQRDIDFNSFNFDPAGEDLAFFDNSENLTLGDWVISLNYDPDPDNYVGKKVSISGFAYFGGAQIENTFNLSRFVVTCCAVDARPIGLPVLLSEDLQIQTEVEENLWYEIRGEFSLTVNEQLVVTANEINQIPEPDDPYVY